MSKTKSHLHMFFLNKLTCRCFKSSPSIYTSCINNVYFLHFPAQYNSRQPNWYHLIYFPSLVPPLLLTSSRRRTISHFLSIESRWARSLWFIFWQRFVPSSLLLSQNWSIKFTPPLHATLSGLPNSPCIAIKISSQS
jgi:hypothetical protein